MYTCVLVSVHMWYTGREGAALGVFLNDSLPYFLKQALLLNLGPPCLAALTGSGLQGLTVSLLRGSEVQLLPAAPGFLCGC